jgi:P4 family phage/plasmid primase-like protien
MSISTKLKFRTVIELIDNSKILDKTDKNITHTSMGDKALDIYPGKYRIDKEKQDKFYELYTKWIFDYNEELHLTEAHNPDFCCVLIDLDFRYSSADGIERKYGIEDIKYILNKYIFYLDKYLKISDSMKEAFILEKSTPKIDPKDEKVVKDGIHIMFPYIVTKYDVLHLVREEIVKDQEVDDYFKRMGYTNTIDDIVDKSVIQRNNWFMYGSSKPGKESYKLTQVFDMTSQNNILPDKSYKNLELVKLLSINSEENLQNILEVENDDFFKKEYETKFGKQKKNTIKKGTVHKTTENLNIIRQLVGILNPQRAESFESWIRLGWCLHNIDYYLLDAWNDFSMNSSKYEEGVCEEKWEAMIDKGLSMGSLCKWAMEDNMNEYKCIMRSCIQNFILSSLNKSHHDIAKVVYEMFKHEFRCVSNRNKIWYQFKNHRWNEIDNAVELKKKISEEVVTEYTNYAGSLDGKIQELNADPGQQELYIKRAQTALGISLQLRNEPFKNHIISACSVLFHDKGFYEKLDSNLDLVGFDNGVYDLDKMEFREGLPEDYISFTTGIDYKHYDDNDEVVENVHDFLKQVLPIPAVKKYVLQVMSSMLSGKTGDEKFHIWTGCHAKGTGIMLSNGQINKVEDILEGDYLMGPDSKPRKVKELVRGNSLMYEIIPSKGEKFIVNEDHIMVLKATRIGSINNSKKESRVKVSWQERDINGYPINKCKNFTYKNNNKKVYRKNVKYHETMGEALEESKKYQEELQNDRNVIKDGDVIEIPLKEYLHRMKKIGSGNYYLYKTGVDFENSEVKIDPYMLGYWLGDGNSHNFGITTMDKEVEEYFDTLTKKENMDKKVYEKENNKAKTINYSSKEKTKNKNRLLNSLKEYNLIKNKHIPEVYKINDRNTRLETLAGIIDSDGHYNKRSNQYEIILKSEKLIDDILYLTRSLGFASTKKTRTKKCCNNGKIGTYYQIVFYGDNLSDIPVKLDRKSGRDRIIKKDPLRYSFKINKLDNDKYYGFKLDNDHLYLTDDFMVHHNCGGNGKSKLIELFEYAFGDYCGNMSVTLITQKRPASNACTPELLKNKGKRFVTLQEPDEDEKIHVGAMKEISGGDRIQARGLHKDPIEFKPQWTVVMTSNVLPEISATDNGTWRRIRVTEFISRFVETEDLDEDIPYQFPIDYDLSTKLKQWPEVFMSILIKEYNNYKLNGLVEPEEVKINTNAYKKESDIFMQFMNESIEKDVTSQVFVDDGYFLFREWYKTSGSNSKIPQKKDFIKNLNNKFGKVNSKNYWRGIKFVKKEENIEEED